MDTGSEWRELLTFSCCRIKSAGRGLGMGMFDHIHYNGLTYQTKDLECTMHNYYIEDGRLLKSTGHVEDRGDKSAPPGSIARLIGCMTWVEEGRKDTNYHGYLNFYHFHDDGRWEEHIAKFTDGLMVEIRDVSTNENPTDSAEPAPATSPLPE